MARNEREGVTVSFNSKAPHSTPWLRVEFDVEDGEPEDLLAALAELGWKEGEFGGKTMPRVPPLDGRQYVTIQGPRGEGLFGQWTDVERRALMPEVRRLLRRQGFDRVPWNRLSYMEML